MHTEAVKWLECLYVCIECLSVFFELQITLVLIECLIKLLSFILIYLISKYLQFVIRYFRMYFHPPEVTSCLVLLIVMKMKDTVRED